MKHLSARAPSSSAKAQAAAHPPPPVDLRFPLPPSLRRPPGRAWRLAVGAWHRRISTEGIRRGWREGLPRYAPLIRAEGVHLLEAEVPVELLEQLLHVGRLPFDELHAEGIDLTCGISRHPILCSLVFPAQMLDLLDWETELSMEADYGDFYDVVYESRVDQGKLLGYWPSAEHPHQARFRPHGADLLQHLALIIAPSQIISQRLRPRFERGVDPNFAPIANRLFPADEVDASVMESLNDPSMTRPFP